MLLSLAKAVPTAAEEFSYRFLSRKRRMRGGLEPDVAMRGGHDLMRLGLWAAFFLVCVSVVMVYSALAGRAMDSASVQLMARQATWVLLGALLMVVVMRIDYRVWQHPTVINTALGVVFFSIALARFRSAVARAQS